MQCVVPDLLRDRWPGRALLARKSLKICQRSRIESGMTMISEKAGD
jgi:hypothetical protein